MTAREGGYPMKEGREALHRIGWKRWLWAIALIFLFNPNFHGIDLLPDFVGYALLVRGLGRVSLLDESFGEARRLFRRLAWLSVARLVGVAWIFTVPSMEEQPTLILLLCFVVGVLELMLVLPACNQLFRGLSYVASRMGGNVVLRSTREDSVQRLQQKLARLDANDPATEPRRRAIKRDIARIRGGSDITDVACRRCRMFAVLKVLLYAIPEMAALTDASYRAGTTLFNWYSYINGFRGMAMIVGLGIGLLWLVHTMLYCRRIEADGTLWVTLADACDADKAAHPERVPQRDFRRSAALVLIAFVFGLNFFVEEINILPGFVMSAFLLVSLIPLRHYLPKRLTVISAAGFLLHGVVSAVVYTMSVRFFAEHRIEAYFRERTVMIAYDRLCVAVAIETAVTWGALALLAAVACSLIHRYTGSHDAATFCYTKPQIERIRRRQLKLHLLPVLILAALTALAHPFYFYFLPEYDFVWLIDVAPGLLLLLFAWLRLHDLGQELDMTKMAEKLQKNRNG